MKSLYSKNNLPITKTIAMTLWQMELKPLLANISESIRVIFVVEILFEK